MNYFFVFLLYFSLFLVGCSSTSEFDLEVEYLYEHTIIMIESSNSSVLTEIGLDASYINKSTAKGSDAKLNQLVLAFNTTQLDSDSETLELLNTIMFDMMEEWYYLGFE